MKIAIGIGVAVLFLFIYWAWLSISALQNQPTIPDGAWVQVVSHIEDALAIQGARGADGMYTVKMTVRWQSRHSADLYARLTESQYLEMKDIGKDFALRGKPVFLTLELKGGQWYTIGVGFEGMDGKIQWIGRNIGLTEGK